MDSLFFSMLALVLQWFRPRYNAQLQILAAQIRILRSRVDASRIVPTPKEKAELLRLGRSAEHGKSEFLVNIVSVNCGRLLSACGAAYRFGHETVQFGC